jgi:O-antigen ligase
MRAFNGDLLLRQEPYNESSGTIQGRKQLNSVMVWALVIMLGLAPLPFGAVHPFSWGFFACSVGIAASIYMIRLWSVGAVLRVPLSSIGVPAALFFILCGILVLQIMPLGAVFPALTAFTSGGMAFAADTLSINPGQTLLMLMRQVTYGLFFFLVVQVSQNRDRRELLLNAMLCITVVYAIEALLSLQMGDTVLGVPKRSYLGSATGPFVNRNSLATFLAMGAVVALIQLGRNIVRQVARHRDDGMVAGLRSSITLYGVAYLLLIGVVFATNSRMGSFCALVGSLVVVAVVLSRVFHAKRAVLALVAGIIISVFVAIFFFGEPLFNRLVFAERSAEGRFELYSQTLELIGMRPWLGFGGGTFEQAFQFVSRPPVSTDVLWDRAHNTYLALWSELGLLGGSLPMLLCVFAGIRLLTALRGPGEDWPFQAAALAVLILCSVHSLADFSLEIQANTLFFVAFLALGLGTTYRNDGPSGQMKGHGQ